MPAKADIHIQKIAPGPPIVTAPVTPTILPAPTLPAILIRKAASWVVPTLAFVFAVSSLRPVLNSFICTKLNLKVK